MGCTCRKDHNVKVVDVQQEHRLVHCSSYRRLVTDILSVPLSSLHLASSVVTEKISIHTARLGMSSYYPKRHGCKIILSGNEV